MLPEDLPTLVREQGPFVFERMFSAVEKVRERLDRTCSALDRSDIPYAIIGGHAVAAWVATKDDGAVRNTRDVDVLIREEDLTRTTATMNAVGFHRHQVMDVTMFLDGPDGKPSQGIHVLFAGKKVKESYATSTPDVTQSMSIGGKQIIHLTKLVEMKLNSYRRKDQTHLIDMIQVGLIDDSWPAMFVPSLGERLQILLDDPDG